MTFYKIKSKIKQIYLRAPLSRYFRLIFAQIYYTNASNEHDRLKYAYFSTSVVYKNT